MQGSTSYTRFDEAKEEGCLSCSLAAEYVDVHLVKVTGIWLDQNLVVAELDYRGHEEAVRKGVQLGWKLVKVEGVTPDKHWVMNGGGKQIGSCGEGVTFTFQVPLAMRMQESVSEVAGPPSARRACGSLITAAMIYACTVACLFAACPQVPHLNYHYAGTCPPKYPICHPGGNCVSSSCSHVADPCQLHQAPSNGTEPAGSYNFINGFDNEGSGCYADYTMDSAEGAHRVWTPVERCVIPIAQPFYMESGFSLAEAWLTAVFLGVDSIHLMDSQVSTWTRRKTFAFGLYQIGKTIYNFGTVCRNWYKQKIYHFSWQGYQCFGAMFMAGSHITTFLNCLAQYLITKALLKRLRAFALGFKAEPGRCNADLWEKGKGKLTEQKLNFLWASVIVSGAIVIGILPSYLVSHIVPGLAVFAPLNITLMAFGMFFSYHLNVFQSLSKVFLRGDYLAGLDELNSFDGMIEVYYAQKRELLGDLFEDDVLFDYAMMPGHDLGRKLTQLNLFIKEELDKKKAVQEKLKEQTQGFSFINLRMVPIIAAICVVIQTSFFQTASIYAGTSYFTAMSITWTERQAGLYFQSNLQKLIYYLTWL